MVEHVGHQSRTSVLLLHAANSDEAVSVSSKRKFKEQDSYHFHFRIRLQCVHVLMGGGSGGARMCLTYEHVIFSLVSDVERE